MDVIKKEVTIPVNNTFIRGDLSLVKDSTGLVIFAHGSGSSRLSSRNIWVANQLQSAGLSTFLFDLLTPQEDAIDQQTREFRFNIPLLAERLLLVRHWIQNNADTANMLIGYFGASTGAAAALIAAGKQAGTVAAVVSRGGRPDLAKEYLHKVQAPTLLIVGELDFYVIALNQLAYDQLLCEKKLVIIPGATHLFEEEGTLGQAAQYTIAWYKKYLQ